MHLLMQLFEDSDGKRIFVVAFQDFLILLCDAKRCTEILTLICQTAVNEYFVKGSICETIIPFVLRFNNRFLY